MGDQCFLMTNKMVHRSAVTVGDEVQDRRNETELLNKNPHKDDEASRKMLRIVLSGCVLFLVLIAVIGVYRLFVPSHEPPVYFESRKRIDSMTVGEFCIGKHLTKHKFGLVAAPASPKHPHRRVDCGEDAFLSYHDTEAHVSLFAVADGVGGWTERGVDSSVFSWLLMDHLLRQFQSDMKNGVKINEPYPQMLLNLAYSQLLAESGKRLIGSSTICLGVLDHMTQSLHVVNLGDSGVLVYRPATSKVVLKSLEQQHAFNFPFQLSPHLGTTIDADLPQHGQLYSVKLQKNDIILFASDGVFDNLFVETDLSPAFEKLGSDNLQSILVDIIKDAIAKGQDTTYRSPFAVNAEKAGRYYVGGKLDDSSAILIRYTP